MQSAKRNGSPSRRSAKTAWGPEDFERETLMNEPGPQGSNSERERLYRDRLGLTTVYQPPDDADVALDIIFVHGFEGGSQSSWMSSWMPAGIQEVFCPATLLPSWDLPPWLPKSLWTDAIRIHTYGFRPYEPGKPSLDLTQLGRDLLSSLATLPSPPRHTSKITLVCERLGGLVAKAALYLSQQMSEWSLPTTIVSLIFFECLHWPRFSTENRSLYDILMSFTSQEELANQLYCRQSFISDFDRKLREREPDLRIFSIRHSLRSPKVHLENYRSLGVPNETSWRLDETSKKVGRALSRDAFDAIAKCLFQTAFQVHQEHKALDVVLGHETQRIRILQEYLLQEAGDLSDDHVRSLSEKRAPGTCRWLLEEDDFRQWHKGSPGREVLVIAGPLGMGKTYLAGFVVDHLREEGHATRTYSFPFDDDRKATPQACLLSLAYQEASVNRQFQQALIRMKLFNNRIDEMSTEALAAKLYEAGMFQQLNARTFLVIDGLDLCLDIDGLIRALFQFRRSCPNVWTLLFSDSSTTLSVERAILMPMRALNARYDVGAMLANHA